TALRKADVAFRYGGDEFVALLVGASASVACSIAEKVRSEIEAHKFLSRESLNIRLTVSIGVANCPEHAASKRDIIEAADGAMYAVKRASRNKVYIAEKKAA
ncbi:MAG: GGDEF domain-containing protein, partial [Deltaproteobacteria bacterium]|nr:GGDEF domain-containing protein [Deltaproteobacteria bacterium]